MRTETRKNMMVAAVGLAASMVWIPAFSSASGGMMSRAVAAWTSKEEPVRNTAVWNLPTKTKLAIDGYDPVAYFPDGGGVATKGNAKFTSEFKGAVYHFANKKNKDAFDADPARYEPAYGGWCAWAMREGDRVEIDPKSFIVKDGRLFLFYDGFLADTRAKWLKQPHATLKGEADQAWTKISGEVPPVASSAGAGSESGSKVSAKGELNERLAEMKRQFEERMPPEAVERSNGAIKAVADSGAPSRALAVGAMAPEFTLPDIEGTPRSLKEMLSQGPVVVTFYRGGWCPFCKEQLGAYDRAMDEVKSMGGQIVAISPQTMENSRELAKSMNLSFVVLSDAGNKTAKEFGVSHKIPESVESMYKPLLSKANGDESSELPMAATYVIAPDGRVAYAYVNADYRERAEPSEIVDALRKVRSTR